MSRKTKIIIAVSAVVLLIAAALVFYFFFWKRAAPAPSAGGAFPPTETATAPTEPTTTEIPPGNATEKPRLTRLTTTPVAGAVAGGKTGNIRVRYVDRATGNVFEISAGGGTATRLTNTTIPKVYEALWNKAGNGVILRYLKDDEETIETFSAKVIAGTGGAAGELQGSFLPADITAIALSPSTSELFYVREENGGAVGIRALFDGSGKTELWRSPVREWLPLWSTDASITLETKPSAIAEGELFSLDRATGAFTPLITGVRGLTALPGHALADSIYAASTDSSLAPLALLKKGAGTPKPLSATTLPEKCAWTKDDQKLYCGVPRALTGGSYPDAWYQGVVTLSDELWEIDTATGNTRLITSLASDTAGELDITGLSLSPDESILIFTNKKDGTLWSYRLTD